MACVKRGRWYLPKVLIAPSHYNDSRRPGIEIYNSAVQLSTDCAHTSTMDGIDVQQSSPSTPATRGYQQEMLEESLHKNIIIALDTGSGKTLIAVLRLKHEIDREPTKVCIPVLPHNQCTHVASGLLVLCPNGGALRTAEIRHSNLSPSICWSDLRLARARPVEECRFMGEGHPNPSCDGFDPASFP